MKIRDLQQGGEKLNQLMGSYSSLVTAANALTGGKVNLPTIKSGSPIANVMTGMNTVGDIVDTFASGQNGANVLTNSTNVQPAAFKWNEFDSTPADFVSYDSVLLFIGEPLYRDNPKGQSFVPLGVCQNFSFNTGVNITTVQELRCEEHLVIPGKTQPVNINISRLCGVWANLMKRVHGDSTRLSWSYSSQYENMRNLFGLYVMVLDTSRRNVISKFYIERCALGSFSFGVSAGTFQVIENCNITGGRIIDPDRIIAQMSAEQEAVKEKLLEQQEAEQRQAQADEERANVHYNGENPNYPGINFTDGQGTVNVNGQEVQVKMQADGTLRDQSGNVVYANPAGGYGSCSEEDYNSKDVQKALKKASNAKEDLDKANGKLGAAKTTATTQYHNAEISKNNAEYYRQKALEAQASGNVEMSTKYANMATECAKDAQEATKAYNKAIKEQQDQEKNIKKATQKLNTSGGNINNTVQETAAERKEKEAKEAQKAKEAQMKAQQDAIKKMNKEMSK